MNLQQIEYIVALDKFKSFSKAAEACFITQATLSTMVKKLEEDGYKVVPKFDIADGEYDLSGAGYVCFISKDGKDTGFAYVTTGGIRGMWDGKKVQVVGGQIPKLMYGEVYKILSKPVTPNK